MQNPWEKIKLEDYEKHMSFGSVQQLQALNIIMHAQLTEFPVKSVMVLGVAGGNGLEHANRDKYEKVYAVDVNNDYLNACREKYGGCLGESLECLNVNLTGSIGALPHAELVIANLLVEFIGCPCFAGVIKQVAPDRVSCTIQVDSDESFVSDSPYVHVFDVLGDIHSDVDAAELVKAMSESGYEFCGKAVNPLPNGKALHRLDFARLD